MTDFRGGILPGDDSEKMGGWLRWDGGVVIGHEGFKEPRN